MNAIAPSGEQVEIRHGSQSAVIVAVGGGVRTYRIDGADVLDGYAESVQCDGARGQQLVPWPNRVKDGRWSWQGRDRQLAISEPEQNNAIHGLARWSEWQVADRSDDAVTMRVRIFPQPGWDWPLEVDTKYALSAAGLLVETTIRNLGTQPAPVAAGAHPYLTAGTETVDECSLVVPAAARIVTGKQQIPTGTEPVDGTAFDFRSARAIGSTRIDFAFADLIRDDDGRARVRLSGSDDRWAALWVDERYPWVEIFTGDALPAAERRRKGLGVEPMSAPPNALATGEGLVALDPGAGWTGAWGIESSLLL